MSDNVIYATFPQYRKPQEIKLEQMAVAVWDHLHAAEPAPALTNTWTSKINDYWIDTKEPA